MRRRAALVAVPAALLLFAGPAHAITNPQIPGLQVALREHGFYRGSIDGIAGPMTAQAVRAFQRKAHITVDGIAGPQTRRALGKLGRPLWGKRKVLARGMVGWDVSVLEFFLARRNLGPGVVDGRFTDRTAAACAGCSARRTSRSTASSSADAGRLQKRRRLREPPPRRPCWPSSTRSNGGALLRSVAATRARARVDGVRIPLERKVVGGRLGSAPGDARNVALRRELHHRAQRAANARRGRAGRRRLPPPTPARVPLQRPQGARRLLSGPLWGPQARPLPETRQFVRNVLALRSRFSSV